MADLLPSVQNGPAVTEGRQSMVSQVDYNRLAGAWEGAFDTLANLANKIAAPGVEERAKEAAYKSVQKDANGNIVVKPIPAAGVAGKLADTYERTAHAVRGSRLSQFLEDKAKELALKVNEPVEKGGGGGDPAWFAKQWEQVSLGAAEGGRGGEQVDIKLAAEDIGSKYYRDIQDKRLAQDGANAKKALLAQAENQENEALQLARANYNGPEFTAALGKLKATYDTLAADPRTGISPALAEQEMLRISRQMAAEGTLGAVQRAYDPANGGSAKSALALADSFETDKTFAQLSPAERKRYRNAGYAYVREQENLRRGQVKAIRPQVKDMLERFKLGADVPDNEVNDLLADLAEAGGAKESQDIISAIHLRDTKKQLGALTTPELANVAATGRLDGRKADLTPFVSAGATADVSKLQGGFASSLREMFDAMPENLKGQVSIYSAYRSKEHQARLFARAVRKYGSPEAARKHVAPPGHSNHNHGLAVDLRYVSDDAKKWIHENAGRFGLNFRMSWEDWHIEPADLKGAKAGVGIGAGGNADLMMTESSGNPSAQNGLGYSGLYQFGAPRLATLGIYTPGASEDLQGWAKSAKDAPGKWSGTFNIPGHPEVKTIDDFLANPEAQQAAYRVHEAQMDKDIASNGLDKYIGQTVGGVPITRDGLHRMMHLGGTAGTVRFLTSGGAEDPADENGMRLSDYALKAARSRPRSPQEAADVAGPGAMMMATVEPGMDTAEFEALKVVGSERIKALIPRLISAAKAFQDVDPEQFRALGTLIQKFGTPENARDYAELAMQDQVSDAARDMPTDQFQAFMTNLADTVKKDTNAYLMGAFPSMQERAQALIEKFRTDPWDAASEIGMNLPSTKAALPFDQPSVLPAALGARYLDSKRIVDKTGAQPSILTKPEQERFAGMLRSADPAQVGQTFSALASLPEEAIKATLSDKTVASAIVAMSQSANFAQATTAYSFLDQIERKMPLDYNDMLGEKSALDLQEWRGRLSAMDEAEYKIWWREKGKGEAPEARKMATEEATKIVGKNYADAGSIARGLAGSSFFQDYNPWAEDVGPVSTDILGSGTAMAADFKRAFIDAYSRNPGNEAGAADFAMKQMAQKWAPSVANNGRIMAFPPEKYLPRVDGSYDWIRDQLEADIRQHFDPKGEEPMNLPGFSATIGLEERVKDYALVADEQTQAAVSNGQPPRYLVIAQDVDGQWHRVETEGRTPLRFVPDVDAAQSEARARFEERRRAQAQFGDLGKPISLEERTEFKPYVTP